MPSYNVHEAKSNLSKLLTLAAQGEEVVIMRAGQPVARLVRCPPARGKKVKLGWAATETSETQDWEKAMTKEEAGRFLGIR